jgi:hypothetical protein
LDENNVEQKCGTRVEAFELKPGTMANNSICSICGCDDDTLFGCGIHGLCIDCCTTWLASITVDAGKLRTHASHDWIGCPGLNQEDGETAAASSATSNQWCDRPIHFEQLILIPKIDELLAAVDRVWKSRLDELTDTLNLRCPSCRTVLDPEAEACTAMCCSFCSAHFCFACLVQFPNPEASHQHVPAAHGCESAFAPKSVVEESHRNIRVKAILDVIRPITRASRASGNDILAKMKDDLEDLNLPSTVEKLEEIAASLISSESEQAKIKITQQELEFIEALKPLGRRVVEFDSGMSSTLLPLPKNDDEEVMMHEQVQIARALRINTERGNWTAVEQILESLPPECKKKT